MTEQLKRIAIAVSIGLAIVLITALVELSIARRMIGPSATLLDDFVIGFAAALSSYVWVSLRAERESRERAKSRQEAIIQERTRIACEIHDVLAQSFAGMILNVEAARDALQDSPEARKFCARALRVAREGLAESRRLVRSVRSPALSVADLRSAIAELIDLLTDGAQLHVSSTVVGDIAMLSPETEGQLLRILREAVTNVVRHANASHLVVNLDLDAGRAKLTIEDDGRGFVPHDSTNGETFGLTSMRERAHDLGGSLSVDSRLGTGTRVTVSIPVPEQLESQTTPRQSARAASAH